VQLIILTTLHKSYWFCFWFTLNCVSMTFVILEG